jgi:hypothetical protein
VFRCETTKRDEDGPANRNPHNPEYGENVIKCKDAIYMIMNIRIAYSDIPLDDGK